MESWGEDNEQREDPICERNEDGIEKYRDTLENLGKMALQKGNMWEKKLLKILSFCYRQCHEDRTPM